MSTAWIIARLTAERDRLLERMSNHCCCEFAEDGETFVKRCKVHADIARERDKLREALIEAERFMAYFSGETENHSIGPGMPLDCLHKIRAALKETTHD